MEIPNVTIEARKGKGSRAAARLRRDGKIPGVLYGHGLDPFSLTMSTREVEDLIEDGIRVVNLTLDGKTQACQLKDAQWDHLGRDLLHIDLLRVDLNERVNVTVPLEYHGTAAGEAEGGQVFHEMTEIEIDCVVSGIPEFIRVDVDALKLDESLHVSDLKMPGDSKAVADDDAVVATCKVPTVSEEEEPTEGEEGEVTEPEVIGKGKAEEEDSDD